MKTVFLIFTAIFLVFASNAQVLQWAKKAGGPSSDQVTRSAIDANGNVYLVGYFQGANVDFDPGSGTYLLSSAGSKDGFVAKYDKDGNFKWAFRLGGSNLDEVGDVAVDHSGNIVIGGYFRGGSVDFDPSAGTAILNSNGESGGDPGYGGDAFLAKYDTLGNYKWAFNIGGTALGDNTTSINVDNNDDVLATGYFTTTVDFNPSAAVNNLNSATGRIFIAKYNPAGQYVWAFNTGQGDTDNTGFKIAADAQNNVLVTGFFQGSAIDFDPSASTNTLSSNGGFDVFVAKYTAAGAYVWAKSAGSGGADVGRSLTIDANNDVYVTGDYNSTFINFNGGQAANNIGNNGGNDLFVVKYSSNGQHLWSFGTGGSGSEFGLDVNRDGFNNILITGAFTGSNVDFDPSPNTITLSSKGGNDVYAVKYSPSGTYLCSFTIGSFNNDNGHSIVSIGNYSYVSGFFNGSSVDFDPTPGTTLLSSSAEDAFFAKYDWTIVPPSGTITGNSNCLSGITQLVFNAASGAGPFTLYISNGSTTTAYNNIQSGVPFNIPTPGSVTTYTLTGIKDANLCSAVTPANSSVLISPSSVPIVTSGNAAICKSDSVQLTAAGGTTYQWSPAAGLSNPAIANPKASPTSTTTYKVVVTNMGGCKDSATLTITIKPPPTISVSPATVGFCNGDSVQLIASGGTTYQWSPATGLSNASIPNPKASPPATTTYKLVVTDAGGCKDSITKVVTKNPSPVVTVSAAASICAGDSTQLSASGGATYQWLPASGLSNPLIAAPKASPVVTTVYKVIIANAQGCKDSATTTVSLKPKPALSVSQATAVCKGDSVQLGATGALSYQWSPVVGLSNAAIANPKAAPTSTTTYKVTGVGANGCSDSANVVVTVNLPPVITLTPNTAICLGDSAQLIASGGTVYQWSPSTGLSSTALASPKASPFATTTYKVKVFSAVGCVDSAFVTISVNPKPVVTVTPSSSICNGDTLQLNASGGMVYQWSPGSSLSNASSPNPLAWPLVTTNYAVTATDANGCKDSAKTIITVTPKALLNIGKDTAICENENLLLDGTLATGIDYLWNTGATTPAITVDIAGIYSVLVKLSGCTSPARDTITVRPLALPTVILGNDTTICSSYALQLKATGKNAASYLWSTGSRDSLIVVNTAGTYSVTASNKCGDASDAVSVAVDICSDDLFFPSAFTPNGDRKNDLFKAGYVQGFQVFDYELQIFNRWGQRVFITSDVTKGWDGRIAGKDQGNAVFVWMAKYRKSAGGTLLMRKGTAALIR